MNSSTTQFQTFDSFGYRYLQVPAEVCTFVNCTANQIESIKSEVRNGRAKCPLHGRSYGRLDIGSPILIESVESPHSLGEM
jgi:hypothetical protein